MNDYVATPDMRILHVLARLCARHEKLYCYPSGQTIVELVWKFTGRRMSRRTLWRHTGAMERDGWLGRTRRHETGDQGQLVCHSTLYVLTRRALKYLRATISNVWNWSTGAAKSLIHIAVTEVAERLARESKSHSNRAARAPPKR